jgi:outer membrane protein
MFSMWWTTVCMLLVATGAVAQANSSGQPALELSLQKAIEIATSPRGDVSVQLALEGELFSRSHYTEARAALMPNLDGYVAEQNQTVNPRALGLQFTIPGYSVPKEVGPFNTFDVRLRLNQNLFDLSAIRHWQSAREDMESSKSETEAVRDRVAGAVADLYANALRDDALVEVSKASLTDAEALRDLALHRAEVGEGTELEVSRANLNVARSRQQLLSAETNRTRTHLELIRTLDLSWDTTLHLTSTLDGAPEPLPAVAAALDIALKSRVDFRLEESRIASAQLNLNAAGSQRVPVLTGYADFGDLEGAQTHTIGAALRVPLFDGGRIESDTLQASSLLRQEEARQKNLRNQVELEVRQALVSLASAGEQIQVAAQAVALGEDELARATRRYQAGLASSLEVVDAQTQLAVARDDQVAAQFAYATARIGLARATGTIARMSF